MIKSKFYLIRGDGEPIYVGFTNRPIKQRFAEHKADKDFSGYEKVTIEKLDELDYNFTWDFNQVNRNALEVSDREAELVSKYNTQDNVYQKAKGGGSVWNYEKWFVKTNKDNPKFAGMSGAEIEEYVELENDRIKKLRSYITHTIPTHLIKQKNYIVDTIPIHLIKQKNYIKHIIPSYLIKQKHYIQHTIPSYLKRQKHYIGHTIPRPIRKQKDYIGHSIPIHLRKQKDYIGHTIPSYSIKQKSYILNTIPIYLRRQKNYISSTKS